MMEELGTTPFVTRLVAGSRGRARAAPARNITPHASLTELTTVDHQRFAVDE